MDTSFNRRQFLFSLRFFDFASKFSGGRINDFKVVHIRFMSTCGDNGKGRLTSNVFLAPCEKMPGRFTISPNQTIFGRQINDPILFWANNEKTIEIAPNICKLWKDVREF